MDVWADLDLPGLLFGQFYSRYSVMFPIAKHIPFSQFEKKNSQLNEYRYI
jgi:hypothetical protein